MPPDHTEQRKLAAIMFTDMVGYSALAQRNDRWRSTPSFRQLLITLRCEKEYQVARATQSRMLAEQRVTK